MELKGVWKLAAALALGGRGGGLALLLREGALANALVHRAHLGHRELEWQRAANIAAEIGTE